MHAEPDIATVAAALSEPVRARMVGALMDGCARTATELALDGGVAASTASAHLAKLVQAGLASMVRQGRHRYFRIADPAVAQLVEGLMSFATTRPARLGPRDPAMREARVCYDHLAGTLGVTMTTRMVDAGYLALDDERASLTPEGTGWLAQSGIDPHAPRRPACRVCLDWSERRMHLAGAVGAALFARLLSSGALARIEGSRGLRVGERARRFVDTLDIRWLERGRAVVLAANATRGTVAPRRAPAGNRSGR